MSTIIVCSVLFSVLGILFLIKIMNRWEIVDFNSCDDDEESTSTYFLMKAVYIPESGDTLWETIDEGDSLDKLKLRGSMLFYVNGGISTYKIVEKGHEDEPIWLTTPLR